MRNIFFIILIACSVEVHSQYVKRRTPVRMNTEAFGNMVLELNRQYQQVRTLKMQIVSELTGVELNSMDNEWKAAYIKNVTEKMDRETADIGPADAIKVVQEIGKEAMSSPELIARYNANHDYIEFRDYVSKNRKDLNIADCKASVISVCTKIGLRVQDIDYVNGNYPDLGNALYSYSLAIINKPRSYRDWLYLIYLSAKCGNDDAKSQAEDYMLFKDKSMTTKHSIGLF